MPHNHNGHTRTHTYTHTQTGTPFWYLFKNDLVWMSLRRIIQCRYSKSLSLSLSTLQWLIISILSSLLSPQSLSVLFEGFLATAGEIAIEYDGEITSDERERRGKDGREREKSEIRSESRSFAVVLQPFFGYSKIPRKGDGNPDMSVFSVDCFHFSALGHEVESFLSFFLFPSINLTSISFSLIRSLSLSHISFSFFSFPSLLMLFPHLASPSDAVDGCISVEQHESEGGRERYPAYFLFLPLPGLSR